MRLRSNFMAERLIIGTRNAGKFAEICDLLSSVAAELTPLPDSIREIQETGTTFAANAGLKASGYARATRSYVLADDSGLEVEALDGRPGVLSARYGGTDTPFSQKNEQLLREIEKSRDPSRRARFVCALAFAGPDGEVLHTTAGICGGTIARSPRGTAGFGYDPIFVPDGHERSFAELSEAEKNKISHRGRAFCEIIPFLRDFFAKLT
jgi:XTP/dITP diphosphohydrolase